MKSEDFWAIMELLNKKIEEITREIEDCDIPETNAYFTELRAKYKRAKRAMWELEVED